MTTNIKKLASLRLFKQEYRESLESFAKGDTIGARESLESEYEEALRVIKEMDDEDREDAQTLALSQYRTLAYVIASSRDDGAAWIGALSNIDLWYKGTTPEELEKLYKSTVSNSMRIAAPRMRKPITQMIDAVFDLRERDLAADGQFRKIAKLSGGLFALSLFNEDSDASSLLKDMDEAETWLESCELDCNLKAFAERIIDMRKQEIRTVADLKSEITGVVDCEGLDIAKQVVQRPLYLERLEFDNEGRFIQAVLKEREDDSDE